MMRGSFARGVSEKCASPVILADRDAIPACTCSKRAGLDRQEHPRSAYLRLAVALQLSALSRSLFFDGVATPFRDYRALREHNQFEHSVVHPESRTRSATRHRGRAGT
jgi:hypothetical protein